MRYDWSKTLSPDESIEKEFGVSPFYLNCILVFSIIVGIIASFVGFYGGIGIVLLGLLYWYYLKKAKHYAFTKKRVILVESFFAVSITTVDFTQMTDVTVEQSVIDQIGKWGTIVINTAGTNSLQQRISFVDNPHELKKLLDSVRDTNVPKVEIVPPSTS